MNKNLFIYLSVAMAFLIPFPARLAYGLVVFIEMQLLMLAGTAGRELFFKIGMEEVQRPLISILLISVTLLYKFILTLISPLMALTMGFSIFIPALCAFLLGTLFEKRKEGLSLALKKNMKLSVLVTSPFLLIFLLRDIIGYGSVTLPSSGGVFAIHIIPNGLKAGTMIASIPGSLFICGICVACMVLYNRHQKKSGSDLENGDTNAENNVSENNPGDNNVGDNYAGTYETSEANNFSGEKNGADNSLAAQTTSESAYSENTLSENDLQSQAMLASAAYVASTEETSNSMSQTDSAESVANESSPSDSQNAEFTTESPAEIPNAPSLSGPAYSFGLPDGDDAFNGDDEMDANDRTKEGGDAE
ncbi:MAG: hypothetical protein IKR40_08595 [Treponema sp.]|nr:hypothetical protein [Treponema sp.]